MMYSLLALVGFVYVTSARRLLATCNEIPAGSTMKNENGDLITFHDPVVADKCSVETDSDGHTRARMFNCSTSGAFENYYAGSDCTGTPHGSNPVTVNGACASGGCAGYTHYQYQHNGNCQGHPDETIKNEYFFWQTAGCQYNQTMACVNGMPQISFFNNTACSGTAQFVMTAGSCNSHGHSSDLFNVTDNPCA
jgi:hypothetical protein